MQRLSFSRIPALRFGPGSVSELADILSNYGTSVLILTGASSLARSGKKRKLEEDFAEKGLDAVFMTVRSEPSPELVDNAVLRFRRRFIDVVCAIGGGSVIDAGKAVSAMLPSGDLVSDYLEGVGTGAVHDGRKTPFVAVPTTAGTGSEATKNAVLSHVGRGGFKKSLRHDNFVPDIAVIDPELAVDCPRSVTAASGMDALCQLIESFVSIKANPLSDTLAISGIEHASNGLVPACTTGSDNVDARGDMAYAAFLSGVTLANAGLGVVHGFASSVGGMRAIPHGVICGTLLAEATAVTIEKLRTQGAAGKPFLDKYARAGRLLSGGAAHENKDDCDRLVDILRGLTDELDMPRLGDYGITAFNVKAILDKTSAKNNPGGLDREDMRRILEARL